MPTTYKATTGHRPLAWAAVFEKIDESLNGQLATLAKLAGGDKADLEEDALPPLRESITMFLIQFLAKCSARPLRSPNKLKATLRHIARKPDEFISDPGTYDPEAVDWVYGAYARQSRDRHAELLRFEIGEGVLSSEAVVVAAAAAIEEIERLNLGKEKGGRPNDNLLEHFSSQAVLLFAAAGGTATATADGPSWRFVELLQSPVSEAAWAARSALTVDSVVRRAVKKIPTQQRPKSSPSFSRGRQLATSISCVAHPPTKEHVPCPRPRNPLILQSPPHRRKLPRLQF